LFHRTFKRPSESGAWPEFSALSWLDPSGAVFS
jgi:hypothetical protein